MNDDIRSTILTCLHSVAPEADLDTLDPAVEWQEQLDLDSMNLITFLIAVEQATGVSIPERDYRKVATLQSLAEYLEARVTTGSR